MREISRSAVCAKAQRLGLTLANKGTAPAVTLAPGSPLPIALKGAVLVTKRQFATRFVVRS